VKKLIAAMFAWSFLLLTSCGTAFTNQDLEKPELAYENINIYYVSDDGAIESESVYLPSSASIIFDEWAARNGIDDVSAPEFKREDNKQIIYPDDPDDPPCNCHSHTRGSRCSVHHPALRIRDIF